MQTGKFTVNEVEERTHVPAGTLRQWERRYGFPNPTRLHNGYRLYSEADVALIERMKQHIADGIPASRAAALVREGATEAPAPGAQPASFDLGTFVRTLQALDGLEVERLLGRAHAVAGVAEVFNRLVEPALDALDAAAERGESNEPAMRHLLEVHLHNLLAAAPHNGGSALVDVMATVQAPRATRALLLLVLLRRRGLSVRYLGAGHAADQLPGLTAPLAVPRVRLVLAGATDLAQAIDAWRVDPSVNLVLPATRDAVARSAYSSSVAVCSSVQDAVAHTVEAARSAEVRV